MDTTTDKKVIYGKQVAPKANEVLATTSGGTGVPKITPTVITSKDATKDLAKIKSTVADINTGITNQATKLTMDKASADAKAKLEAKEKADFELKNKDLNIKKDALKETSNIINDVPYGNGTRKVTYDDGTTEIVRETRDGNTSTYESTGKSPEEFDYETYTKNYEAEAKKVSDTILNIQNGTVPLNAGEQAQVEGLKQQFQVLIDQQVLENAGAKGTANIRGYQTGAAEYDPNFQVKTIGSIVTAGFNKVADLNIKMSSSVASMIQGFKDGNIKAITNAWDTYKGAADKRAEQLKKTVDDVNAKIKEANTAKQKVKDNIDEVLKDVSKNNAPKEIKDAISSSSSLAEAINNAGEYLQTATGIIGEYLQSKRDAIAKGLTPLDWDSWRAKDEAMKAKAKGAEAYNTAYNTAAGKAKAEAELGVSDSDGNAPLYNGMKPATATAVRSQVNAFKTEPSVQNFKVIQEGRNFANLLKNDTKNPADDQGLIYALAKALDPGSVVREGEYATAQKYSQSWVAAYGKGITQALAGTGFLSETARKNIKKTIETKFNASKATYNNDKKEYIDAINNLTGRKDGDKFLKDYAIKEEPKILVNKYVEENPDQAENIAKMYEIPGATDEDILEYINRIVKNEE